MAIHCELHGYGISSTLGQGVAANLQGLLSEKAQFNTLEISGFDEELHLPYLEAKAARSLSAGQRMEILLDAAITEAFTGCELTEADKNTLPIFIGSSSYGTGLGEELYRSALNTSPQSAYPLPLGGFDQISSHLQKQHRLRGQDYAFNTACTSSANALLSAIQSIQLGVSEYALVVGIETFNITSLTGFYGMQLLSNQAMSPFDKRRNGLVLGEGCAVLLLKASATRQKPLIFCGGASGCDTFSISASNPDGSHIATVMQQAMDSSQVGTDDILAIKAHGTASPLNDDGEAAAMRSLFQTLPPFFALKPYIGHTLGACGALETVLTAVCLDQGKIPATAGFNDYDEKLGVRPITATQRAGRGYYMLNYFGFGGNNCSLIIHTDSVAGSLANA